MPSSAPAKQAPQKGGKAAPPPKSRGRRAFDATRKPSWGGKWQTFKPRDLRRRPTRADAGGFVGGLMLYTVVIIYIRYGPAGWKGWLKAKFLNQPMGASGGSGGGSSAPYGGQLGGGPGNPKTGGNGVAPGDHPGDMPWTYPSGGSSA